MERPELCPPYPPPIIPVSWSWPGAREHNADCQEKEIPKAPEQAGGGVGHTHSAGLPRQTHVRTAKWTEPCWDSTPSGQGDT